MLTKNERTSIVTQGEILRTSGCAIGHRCANLLATTYPLNAQNAHETLDRASCNAIALTIHLFPDLACPIDAKVLLPDSFNLGLEQFVPLCTLTTQLRVAAPGGVAPVG